MTFLKAALVRSFTALAGRRAARRRVRGGDILIVHVQHRVLEGIASILHTEISQVMNEVVRRSGKGVIHRALRLRTSTTSTARSCASRGRRCTRRRRGAARGAVTPLLRD